MAILEYLKAFRRRWILILGCFMLATAIGYAVSPEEPTEPSGAGYEASQTLIPSPEITTVPNLHLAAHLAIGPDVARLAAQELPAGVEPPGPEAVTAEVSPEAGSLIIRVTNQNQTHAGLLAQAYSTATIEFFQASTVQSQDEALEDARSDLENIAKSLNQLQQQSADDPDDAIIQAQLESETTRYSEVFQRVQDLVDAEEPPAPMQVLGTAEVTELDPGFIQPPDDRRARALLVGAVGLLLGLGLAITVDRLDTKLRERDEVEDAFGLPVLSEIPIVSRRVRADHGMVTALRPDSIAAEAYRSLRSAITLVTRTGQSRGDDEQSHSDTPKVLVVAGAEGSQGKSTTVANLAVSIAEMGKTVIVIDCDFRKPEAHQYLVAKPRNRLADLATGYFSGYLDQMLRSTSIAGVELVSSIEPVRDHTSAVSRLPGLIAEARGRADVVLIDSSPLLVTSDAVDVLQYADAALMVCRAGHTTYGQATRARRLLQRADAKVLGVVLTGTPRHRGTPYGQPNRRQRLVAGIGKWAVTPGPDLDERITNGRDAHTPAPDRPASDEHMPDRRATARAAEPDYERRTPEHTALERPAERRSDRTSGQRVHERVAEPITRERQSPEPIPTGRPSKEPESAHAASDDPASRIAERPKSEPQAPKRDVLGEQPTMEFSTVEAAAAAVAAAESLPTRYRTSRDRRTFEDRAEAAARKVPTDSSSD